LHQVGTSSLLIYMMHGHTYIKFTVRYSWLDLCGIVCCCCHSTVTVQLFFIQPQVQDRGCSGTVEDKNNIVLLNFYHRGKGRPWTNEISRCRCFRINFHIQL